MDVRIIASTNRDLETLVQEGKFRLDLYYRLSVIPILMPPLRDRDEDIVPIAQHFVEFFGANLFKKSHGPDRRGARGARGVRVAGQRPRAAQRHRARGHPLPRRRRSAPNRSSSPARRSGRTRQMESATGNLSIAEMEKRLIGKVLGNTSWRRTEAARILGINRTTLHNKIREYELAPGPART